MAAPLPQPMSEAQRSAILDRMLMQLASGGGIRIESRMPTWAVIVTGQKVNSVAHLLATIFLCGLWLPIWIISEASGGEKRSTISVDERGQVLDSSRSQQSETTSGMTDYQKFALILGILFLLLILITRFSH